MTPSPSAPTFFPTILPTGESPFQCNKVYAHNIDAQMKTIQVTQVHFRAICPGIIHGRHRCTIKIMRSPLCMASHNHWLPCGLIPSLNALSTYQLDWSLSSDHVRSHRRRAQPATNEPCALEYTAHLTCCPHSQHHTHKSHHTNKSHAARTPPPPLISPQDLTIKDIVDDNEVKTGDEPEEWAAIGLTVSTYTVIGLGLLLVFELFRGKRTVFAQRTVQLQHRSPPLPGRSPLSWLRPVLLTPQDEVRPTARIFYWLVAWSYNVSVPCKSLGMFVHQIRTIMRPPPCSSANERRVCFFNCRCGA